MNINIDIKAIARKAEWEYHRISPTELHAAPMIDIADYCESAVEDWFDNMREEYRDQLLNDAMEEVQNNA